MNWVAIAAISEFLGAVAVVVTLGYLAAQIKQSNKIAQEENRHRVNELGQGQIILNITHPEIIRAFTANEISYEEKVKLSFWLTAAIRNQEYMWFSHKNGMIDKDMYKAYSNIIPLVLGTVRARKWWETHTSTNEFDSEFVAYVNNIMKNTPLTKYFESIDEL